MTRQQGPPTILLTLCAVLLALVWWPAPGTTDVAIFLRWAAAAAGSLRGSYATFYTYGYPPLHFVILGGAARLAQAMQTDLFTGFKLSLLLSLLLTGGLFWLWTRNLYLSLGLFLALLPSAMTYGYTDIYFAVFLVGALWALHSQRLALFTVLYCGACLVKLQPLILVPFLVIYLLGVPHLADWRQIDVRRLGLRVILPAALIGLGTLAYFGKPFLDALAVGLSNPFLSGQALNLNWIVTFGIRALNPQWFGGLTNGLIVPIDTQDWHAWLASKILFWLLFVPTWFVFARSRKTFDDLIWFGLIGYLTYFMLNAGVHENHLFMAVILAAVLAWRRPDQLATFAVWALAANINLFVFYGADGSGWALNPVAGVDITLPLAVVFVALFAFYYFEAVVVGSRRRALQP